MTLSELVQFLPKLYPVILVIGLIVGCVLYMYLDELHKSIFYYLIIMLIIDLAGRTLKIMYGNNLVMLPIYSFIELVFFVYFYNKHLLSKQSKILIGISIISAIYIIAEILQYFVFNSLDIKQFQPYSKIGDNFVVILFALLFFYQKMNDFKESRWGNFKLNAVILLFFTMNTIIFLPFNFLINELSGVKFYFLTFNVIVFLLFCVYLISLVWENGQTRKKLDLK